MPYSIFYNGHYVVHGIYNTKRLGRPASAGCVRLHPDHAAILFSLAKPEGLKNTRIVFGDRQLTQGAEPKIECRSSGRQTQKSYVVVRQPRPHIKLSRMAGVLNQSFARLAGGDP